MYILSSNYFGYALIILNIILNNELAMGLVMEGNFPQAKAYEETLSRHWRFALGGVNGC